jgi:hypothetical protein
MSEDGYIEKEGYAREGYVLFFVSVPSMGTLLRVKVPNLP